MRYVTANKIREIDKLAQTKYSIPSLILMENAGRTASEEILIYIDNNRSKRVAIFCGKGNNGGDGLVVARHLKSKDINVVVYLLGYVKDVKKIDPVTNLNIVRKMGIKIIELPDLKSVKKLRRRFSCDVVIDAIFGTGFSGKLPEHIRVLVHFLNKTGKPIFSLDVPSGLDATTGEIADTSIKATKTITFGLPKTGFIKGDGPDFTGQVITRNISYPQILLR
ncbi:unnamed protein product, partial [marine sediment metagenome]